MNRTKPIKTVRDRREQSGLFGSEASNKPVVLYTDKLMYSPLDFPHYIQKTLKRSVVLTKNPKRATIIASSYLTVLKKYLPLNKKYLLWTHEPYHNWIYTPTITVLGKEIHIMNVYTGNVFCNNYRYFYFKRALPLLTDKNYIDFRDPSRTVIAFSTNYPPSYYSENKYTTLPKRYEIIEYGYTHKRLKVWGKGFDHMSEGNTRDSIDKGLEKSKILASYDFNLAIENTEFPYYVTEKIWESIVNLCLPIYWSNCTIYTDFPKNSFIDYRDFTGPEELFRFIDNMTIEEFRRRMNLCIMTFNKVLADTKHQKFYPCPNNRNLERVNYSQCYSHFMDKLLVM